jgi:hypothetical protein
MIYIKHFVENTEWNSEQQKAPISRQELTQVQNFSILPNEDLDIVSVFDNKIRYLEF